MIILLIAALLILGVVYGSSAKGLDRRTVPALDVARYMGVWYEIARYDHRFERGLVEVKAVYRVMDNGLISVENSGTSLRTGKRKVTRGKAKKGSAPGQLRVSFFWFFYTDYNVMELGPDYDWALVGSRSPKYLWILSRTPTLPSHTLSHILQLAEKRGYRADRLFYVDQGV